MKYMSYNLKKNNTMNIFFSLLYRFKITRFQKHEFFQNHTISKTRIFSKSHDFKITRFLKSRDFKITLFQKITLFSKSRDFKNHIISKSRYFKNHAIFLGFLIIFKTSVFLKKKFPVQSPFRNSPFENM